MIRYTIKNPTDPITTIEFPFTYTPGYSLLKVIVDNQEVQFSETTPNSITLAIASPIGKPIYITANLPSVLDTLPEDWQRDDPDGLTMLFLTALDAMWTALLHEVRRQEKNHSSRTCEPKYLYNFAHELGWNLDSVIPAFVTDTAQKVRFQRKLIELLYPLYALKGTAPGMETVLRVFLGVECTITSMFARGWRLGSSTLGNNTYLTPVFDRDPGFDSSEALTILVRVPRTLTLAERSIALQLLDIMKSAAAIIELEERQPPATGWVLGQSELGVGGLGRQEYTFMGDGIRTDFQFDYAFRPGTLYILRNGVEITPPSGYTELTPSIIRLASPLATGQTLYVLLPSSTVLS